MPPPLAFTSFLNSAGAAADGRGGHAKQSQECPPHSFGIAETMDMSDILDGSSGSCEGATRRFRAQLLDGLRRGHASLGVKRA
jgi:hypothetical protein